MDYGKLSTCRCILHFTTTESMSSSYYPYPILFSIYDIGDTQIRHFIYTIMLLTSPVDTCTKTNQKRPARSEGHGTCHIRISPNNGTRSCPHPGDWATKEDAT
ncbi:hypothetical protein T09_5625 [Trichinella sp. T9]|nr:hypothetical protein T09_5625 [Trichinella sp. T9]